MEQAYPHLVPTVATVVIANVLPSGAAFGVRMDNGDNCYVPVDVSRSVRATVGAELTAKLVPNRFADKAERTPWLAVYMSPASAKLAVPSVPVQYAMPFDQFDIEPPAKPTPTTADLVHMTMKRGGVWTVASLFEHLFPNKLRAEGLTEYNVISATIRSMYAKGHCAKFQLWRSSDQSKPSREWFTCYPEKADVDEWEEV